MAIQPLRLDPITVLGKQLVIELFDCVDQRFDDIQWIEESMLEAARQANATIITSAFHKFSPIGISGVVVIAESHLAIHTWPEYGYAAVDVFTCGDVLDGAQAVRVLSERLGSRRHLISSMDRGLGGHRAARGLGGRQGDASRLLALQATHLAHLPAEFTLPAAQRTLLTAEFALLAAQIHRATVGTLQALDHHRITHHVALVALAEPQRRALAELLAGHRHVIHAAVGEGRITIDQHEGLRRRPAQVQAAIGGDG